MATTKRLESLANKIDQSLEVLASSKKKSELKQTLTDNIQSLSSEIDNLVKNEKRKYVKVRKGLVSVNNVFQGLLEGISSGETSLSEFRTTVERVQNKFLKSVYESLANETPDDSEQVASLSEKQEAIKESLKEELESDEELQQALVEVQKALKRANRLAAIDKSVSEQIASFGKYRAQLPIKLPSDFMVVRMPIIPIFSNLILKESDFKAIGINAVSIEGYVALHDQILICVSESKAKTYGVDTTSYVQSVIALLNERGSQNYSLVTDAYIKNPRNVDIRLYWVLPTKKLSGLTKKIMSGRKANNLKWGLAF